MAKREREDAVRSTWLFRFILLYLGLAAWITPSSPGEALAAWLVARGRPGQRATESSWGICRRWGAAARTMEYEDHPVPFFAVELGL